MLVAEMRKGLREDWSVIALVCAYIVTLAVVFGLNGLPFVRLGSYLSNLILYAASVTMVLALLLLWRLFRTRPHSPLSYLPEFAREVELGARLGRSVPVLIALVVFMPTFSAVKSAIPFFNPYSFDPLFTRMDQALHGGHAWELIHPVVGYPPVSFTINLAYHLWILLLYLGVPLVCAWITKPDLRRQILLCYVLCWIVIGTVLATALSSVGPCFVEYFFGDPTFRPLMDYLATADKSYPLLALDVQQELLAGKRLGSAGLGRGISAMPSMHVAIACLFAIAGWRHSRAVGWAATAFLVLILIGSVHLGYHYAVDGYLSMLVTPLLWVLAGMMGRSRVRDKTGQSANAIPPVQA